MQVGTQLNRAPLSSKSEDVRRGGYEYPNRSGHMKTELSLVNMRWTPSTCVGAHRNRDTLSSKDSFGQMYCLVLMRWSSGGEVRIPQPPWLTMKTEPSLVNMCWTPPSPRMGPLSKKATLTSNNLCMTWIVRRKRCEYPNRPGYPWKQS